MSICPELGISIYMNVVSIKLLNNFFSDWSRFQIYISGYIWKLFDKLEKCEIMFRKSITAGERNEMTGGSLVVTAVKLFWIWNWYQLISIITEFCLFRIKLWFGSTYLERSGFNSCHWLPFSTKIPRRSFRISEGSTWI